MPGTPILGFVQRLGAIGPTVHVGRGNVIDPVACNAAEPVFRRMNAGEARGHVRGAVICAKPRDDPLLARLAPQVVVVMHEANGGIVGGGTAGG